MTLAIDLPAIADGLPPAPPTSLDPYLDAGAQCFARFGVNRTTVPDIARELGVSRTTVYRQVGTVNQLAGLLFNRELHRFVAVLPKNLGLASGPEAVIETVDSLVTYSRSHPVLEKVIQDESELIGPFVTRGLPVVIHRVACVVAPLLEEGMRVGFLAQRDSHALTEWLVRITVSTVLSPPKTDTASFLRQMLLPILSPGETPPPDTPSPNEG